MVRLSGYPVMWVTLSQLSEHSMVSSHSHSGYTVLLKSAMSVTQLTYTVKRIYVMNNTQSQFIVNLRAALNTDEWVDCLSERRSDMDLVVKPLCRAGHAETARQYRLTLSRDDRQYVRECVESDDIDSMTTLTELIHFLINTR